MTQRLALLLFLFVPLAACQPAPGTESSRTVSVSGEGDLVVQPEIAIIRLSVQARERELDAAREKAANVVNAVLALADSLNIPRQQVQSSQLRVQPEFDWNEGRQTLRGYLVHRDVHIELEDLAQLGPLVERAVRTGVNDISEPELRVKDPRKLHREALELAARDARANAEVLAETLGARLGSVKRIHAIEQESPPVRPMMEMQRMRAADSSRGEQSYESGRITVQATVKAEFELR